MMGFSIPKSTKPPAGAGSDRLESSLAMTGLDADTTLHFLRKASKGFRKFQQAFQIFPKTINFLQILSKNLTGKLLLIKALRPNLPAERSENFSVTPRLGPGLSASDFIRDASPKLRGVAHRQSGRI
jgi:hypothetical protein